MKSPYDEVFFQTKLNQSKYTSEIFYKILREQIGDIKSTLDIGCGTGSWLKNFSIFGVNDILGIDYYVDLNFLEIPKDKFKKLDLSKPLDLKRKFDVILCLEVAEHIPVTASNTLIDSLVKHSDYIVFSAAIPGQGGCNHINEQWQEYWVRKFASNNYTALDCFRPKLWNDNKIPFWFKQNTLLYYNKERNINQNINSSIINIVHPDLFAHTLSQSKISSSLLKKIYNKFFK